MLRNLKPIESPYIQLDILKKNHLYAVYKRNQDPANFINNLAYLIHLSDLYSSLSSISNKHLFAIEKSKKNLANHHSLFKTLSQHKVQKNQLKVAELMDYFDFDKEKILQELAKEPRVTELTFEEFFSYDKKSNVTHYEPIYRIGFCDDSKIEFKDLNLDTLLLVKQQFNLKMQSLANENQPITRLSSR